MSKRHLTYVVLLFVSLLLGLGGRNAKAQVSPAEITNPRLKAAEGAYFSQIMALYRAAPSIFRLSSADTSASIRNRKWGLIRAALSS